MTTKNEYEERKAWTKDMLYYVLDLAIGDEEQTGIEIALGLGLMDRSLSKVIEWTIQNIGYSAANALYIQWVFAQHLQKLTVAELETFYRDWMAEYLEMTGDEEAGVPSDLEEMIGILFQTLSPADGEGYSKFYFELMERVQR